MNHNSLGKISTLLFILYISELFEFYNELILILKSDLKQLHVIACKNLENIR